MRPGHDTGALTLDKKPESKPRRTKGTGVAEETKEKRFTVVKGGENQMQTGRRASSEGPML